MGKHTTAPRTRPTVAELLALQVYEQIINP
jgi:hypothetical protein